MRKNDFIFYDINTTIMGASQSRSYTVYSSDTTDFWDYNLLPDTKDMSVFQLFVNHCCERQNTDKCNQDQVAEQIEIDNLDGIKVNKTSPPTIDDEASRNILKQLTYLSFTDLPVLATGVSILDFLKGPENLRKLELNNINKRYLSPSTWKCIANANLKYLEISTIIEFSDMDEHLSDDVLTQICHNTKHYSLPDKIIKRVLKIPGLAKIYSERSYGTTPYTSWVSKPEQIDDFIHLLEPNSPLVIDSNDPQIIKPLIAQANTASRVSYLGFKTPVDPELIPMVNFTDTLHFWNNEPLPVVAHIARNSPTIIEITSGFAAISSAELEHLAYSLPDTREIKLNVHVNDKPPAPPAPKPSPVLIEREWNDPIKEQEALVNLLNLYEKQLNIYTDTTTFRTHFRSKLNKVKRLSDLFAITMTTAHDFTTRLSDLNSRYDEVTKGRHLKGIASNLINCTIIIKSSTDTFNFIIKDISPIDANEYGDMLDFIYA